MPMNYYGGYDQDLWSAANLGNTYANAVNQLYNNRIAAQKWQEQMAIERARLQMQQAEMQRRSDEANRQYTFDYNKWLEGAPGRKAETDWRQAEAKRLAAQTAQTQSESMSAGKLGDLTKNMYETDPTKNPDTYAFLRALSAAEQARLAGSQPGTVVKQMNELAAARDPRIQTLMATGTPLYHNVTPGSSVVDFTKDVPSIAYQAPQRQTYGISPELRQLQVAGGLAADLQKGFGTKTPMYSQMTNIVQQLIPKAFPSTGQGQGQPIFARNPNTGQRIQSTDGGATWAPAP